MEKQGGVTQSGAGVDLCSIRFCRQHPMNQPSSQHIRKQAAFDFLPPARQLRRFSSLCGISIPPISPQLDSSFEPNHHTRTYLSRDCIALHDDDNFCTGNPVTTVLPRFTPHDRQAGSRTDRLQQPARCVAGPRPAGLSDAVAQSVATPVAAAVSGRRHQGRAYREGAEEPHR